MRVSFDVHGIVHASDFVLAEQKIWFRFEDIERYHAHVVHIRLCSLTHSCEVKTFAFPSTGCHFATSVDVDRCTDFTYAHFCVKVDVSPRDHGDHPPQTRVPHTPQTQLVQDVYRLSPFYVVRTADVLDAYMSMHRVHTEIGRLQHKLDALRQQYLVQSFDDQSF